MFILEAAPTFEVRALIPQPGGVEPRPLVYTARHRRVSELKELQRRMQAEGMGDAAVLAELMADWQVQRLDGTPVPFNAEALEELLDEHPKAGPALYDAYLDALREARSGN